MKRSILLAAFFGGIFLAIAAVGSAFVKSKTFYIDKFALPNSTKEFICKNGMPTANDVTKMISNYTIIRNNINSTESVSFFSPNGDLYKVNGSDVDKGSWKIIENFGLLDVCGTKRLSAFAVLCENFFSNGYANEDACGLIYDLDMISGTYKQVERGDFLSLSDRKSTAAGLPLPRMTTRALRTLLGPR